MLQNTLFTVIPFHHLGDCDLYTPPWGVKGRQNQVENNQPGQNEELVLKWGTTFVAWTRVFKHCSFKTTDFKSLKLEVNRYGFFSCRCRYLEIRAADIWCRFFFFFFFFFFSQSKMVSYVSTLYQDNLIAIVVDEAHVAYHFLTAVSFCCLKCV